MWPRAVGQKAVLKQAYSVCTSFDDMNLFGRDCFKHHNECIINLCSSINIVTRESNIRIVCSPVCPSCFCHITFC